MLEGKTSDGIMFKHNISGNTGRKTPISFNLQNYVEKHCNGQEWEKIKKRSKEMIEKRNIHNCKNIVLTKNWFVFSNFWEFPKDHTEK